MRIFHTEQIDDRQSMDNSDEFDSCIVNSDEFDVMPSSVWARLVAGMCEACLTSI